MYNQVVFSKLATGLTALMLAAVPMCAFASDASTPQTTASASTSKVTGTIIDPEGEPVIGATVKVNGTNVAMASDIDGRFSINVSKPSKITVTYVGYSPVEMDVKPGEDVNITMQENSELLDEVVVVGFAVQKKVNLTGAVGTASGKDIAQRPVQNVTTALQGVIPGLNISNASNGGELNSSKSIDVRGMSTIGTGSSGGPLILVDGMEISDMNTLNPNDIENISVLKDAAAASIYGSRAPFGVILITTKQGAEGRTQIHYGNSFRWNKPLYTPNTMDSWQYANYLNDVERNTSGGYRYDEEQMQKIYDYYTGASDYVADTQVRDGHLVWGLGDNFGTYANVNWLKEYYKDTAFAQDHNLSINGGNDKISYYVSGAFLDQGGFMRHGEDNYKRYNIMGKISAQATPWLKIGFTSRWMRSDYDRATRMDGGFYDNMLKRGVPTNPKYDSNGYYMSEYNYITQLEDGGRSKYQNDELANQLSVTITPLKNWNIVGEFNTRINNNWEHIENLPTYAHYADDPELTYKAIDSVEPDKASVKEYSYRSTYLNANVFTNYMFTLNKVHNFTVLAGMQVEDFKHRDVDARRENLISVDLPVLNLATSATGYSIGGKYDEWNTVGFFGRINYDYDSRYLLEVNMRYDGSSRFRSDHRWVLSPSFSIGWNMAREAFMEPLTGWLNALKPRFSYGQLANQNTINWYPTYRAMGVWNNSEGWLINGEKPNAAGFPDLITRNLTWEKIRNVNIGLDWAMFNNRFTGSFDYFWRTNKDMLGDGGITLPAVLGATPPKQNCLSMRTAGWELQLSWRDRIGEVSYSATFNLSDDRTKILDFPNREGYLNNYIPGEYVGDIYGLTTIGIAQTQEEMDAHIARVDQTNLDKNTWRAGDIMYEDIDGDGEIRKGTTINDLGDLKKIGNSTPRYRIGFNLYASWKGIDVSAFFQGVCKRDYYFNPNSGGGTGGKSAVFWGATSGGQFESVFFEQHLDYWRDENSGLGANYDAYYARPVYYSNKNREIQTRYLQDASYLRLKNLQVGYSLPEKWMKAIHFQKIRVFFSAENLCTWTKMSKTVDPESLEVAKMKSGSTYPLAKTFSFGLTADF